MCLIFTFFSLTGNEGRGVNDQLLQLCNHLVTIPPAPGISQTPLDSLNVSVATGTLIVIDKIIKYLL